MQHLRGICTLLKLTLPALLFAGALAGKPAMAAQDYTTQMQLNANNEMLTLLLRPSQVTANIRVVDNNGVAMDSGVDTYIGKIKGDDNSWVRLTRSATRIDGVISRFGKRFRLQQFGNSAPQVKPLADKHDLRITLTSNNAKRATLNNITQPQVTKVAKIGIVVDSKYNDIHNGKGLEYALSIINAVDGIYREEFGLALQVETAINIVDTANDPFLFDDVKIETILRGFRDYRLQSNLLGQNIGMAHLFSGNRPIDEPVGLAWIDTACRADGYDVGLSTPYQHDILLAAHEIAHNLGALHDSDTACASSTDKVMWPYISSATSQQFSSCTVKTVKRRLQNSCHADAIDLELALAIDTDNTVHATVVNTDTLRTTPAATLAIDLPEGGTATTLQGKCDHNTVSPDHIECTIGTLAPGADSVVIFQVDSEVQEELQVSVDPETYVDVAQHNNSGTIHQDGDEIIVSSENQSRTYQLAVLQSDDTQPALTNGGNSGVGAFSALAVLFILMIRRRQTL